MIALLVLDFKMLRSGPFWEKYQQLEHGMTRAQVEELLGPPIDEMEMGGILAPHVCFWNEGRKEIVVSFNMVVTEDDLRERWGVSQKGYHPATLWDLLWRRSRR
jgi:hypothetical protein